MTLQVKDNELLTRVEHGAPMGEMLRNTYWFPATLSSKLVADDPPLRVRLIGENFVAFRSTDGRVGFFDEACPHRRASLMLAHNADNSLRCLYHGWKFGVDGNVLEVPAEPNNPEFCRKVPLRHYPVREAGGMVWVWIGRGAPVRFPDFEFNNLPPEQVSASEQHVACNWVQNHEATLDPPHLNWLHRGTIGGVGIPMILDDSAPANEFEDTSYGYRHAQIRQTKNAEYYVRVNEFVLPWQTFLCVGQGSDEARLTILSIPTDDTHCVHRTLHYNPNGPLKPDQYFYRPPNPADWPPMPPASERWGQDRVAMAQGNWSGYHHPNTEDFAITMAQGEIVDRSREYLNSGDRGVIYMRQQILNAVKRYVDGKPLRLAHDDAIDYAAIHARTGLLSSGDDWRAIA